MLDFLFLHIKPVRLWTRFTKQELWNSNRFYMPNNSILGIACLMFLCWSQESIIWWNVDWLVFPWVKYRHIQDFLLAHSFYKVLGIHSISIGTCSSHLIVLLSNECIRLVRIWRGWDIGRELVSEEIRRDLAVRDSFISHYLILNQQIIFQTAK